MALILLHQNVSDFVSRLREDYRGSEKDRTLLLALFVIARIQDGTFTDGQLRIAFGLTSTQWNALKTKMINLIAAGNAVASAAGE